MLHTSGMFGPRRGRERDEYEECEALPSLRQLATHLPPPLMLLLLLLLLLGNFTLYVHTDVASLHPWRVIFSGPGKFDFTSLNFCLSHSVVPKIWPQR